jgi:bifunctional DNase/RNase
MVELVVSDILSKTSDERAYVMILREREGSRKILIAVGYGEAQAIAFALKGIDTKRPITHDLFRNFAEAFGATMQCITINKISDGTFYSNMLFRQGDELREVDARTSDAVAVALRFGAPIYIDEQLLNKVSIRDEWGGAISIPITVADTNTLQKVLSQAVKDENYELAMKIKEEIDSRKVQDESEINTEQN